MIRLAAILPGALLAAGVVGGTPSVASAQGVVAIEGATVYVTPDRSVENATVVLRNGRVAAVGAGVKAPAGARRIDAKGKVVTAGLVDSASRLGLVEIDIEESTREGLFKPEGEPTHAAYRVSDGYNPSAVTIPIARGGGVTSAVVEPRGALISGMSAWVSLAVEAPGRGIVRAPLAMNATLGEEALRPKVPARGEAVETLRELLDDARVYARRRAAFERNQTRRFAASRLDLEALVPVVQGRLPLVVTVHRASDILVALELADELDLRLVVRGGAEAWRVAPQLARARVPVILDPIANLPGSFDVLHTRNDSAVLLARAGVPVLFSRMNEASEVRTLRQIAGVAVAHGLPWKDAFAAITVAPARAFGLRARGTLEVGSVADVVVWTGDPLETLTRVERVLIGGVEQPLTSHQTLLLERYRRLPGAKPPARPRPARPKPARPRAQGAPTAPAAR